MMIRTTRTAGRSRRDFLTRIAAAGLVSSAKGLFTQQLVTTPAQTLGPYHPNRMPLDLDNDLLRISDSITPAVGDVA